MELKLEDLKVGDIVWTNDGYGTDLVKILKPVHIQNGIPVVECLFLEYLDRIDILGGIDPYCPDFYPLTDDEQERYKYLIEQGNNYG